MIKRFGIGLINKTMNLNLLWFLPAVLIYIISGIVFFKQADNGLSDLIASILYTAVGVCTSIGLINLIK